MEITAQNVNELRQRTGIGMMDCKKALVEAKGDVEEAIIILRKKGFARAKDKMNRKTSEGQVGSYIHMNGKIGVLVEINCESDFVSRNQDFQELVKNVAMHIAATDPQYVSSGQIPEEILENEKEIIRGQFKDSKKPPEIVEKIVEGKLGKFYSEVCLLNQPFIKDDKMSVEQLITTYVAKFGENIRVKRFARFALSES
jgi:elongation factor Ts